MIAFELARSFLRFKIQDTIFDPNDDLGSQLPSWIPMMILDPNDDLWIQRNCWRSKIQRQSLDSNAVLDFQDDLQLQRPLFEAQRRFCNSKMIVKNDRHNLYPNLKVKNDCFSQLGTKFENPLSKTFLFHSVRPRTFSWFFVQIFSRGSRISFL